VSLSDLKKHLKRNQCTLFREGGNHSIYKNEISGLISPVPRHTEIAPGIVRKICDELGIPRPLGR